MHIYTEDKAPGCSLCTSAPEMNQHVRSGWEMEAGVLYAEGRVNRHICAEYRLKTGETSMDGKE